MNSWVSLLSALAGVFGAIVAASLSFQVQRKKLSEEINFQQNRLNEEIRLQRERLQREFATEDSVEIALKHFLELYNLPYRSFPMIRHHIGGFEPNELRKLLVRAGAVRFMAADGTELWALRKRVADDFKRGRWKHKDSPYNKTPENELFPGAFEDQSHY